MFVAIRLALPAVSLAAALAACSGAATGPSVATLVDPGASGSVAASTAPSDPREAFLAYAACMRDNGIDMPDPEVVPGKDGAGGVGVAWKLGPGSETMDKEDFRAADATCKHNLANVVGESAGGGLSPEDEERLLRFARCMREHGVDMPDPGANGVIVDEKQGSGGKFDPNDPDFQAAQQACGGLLPGKVEGADPGKGGAGGAPIPLEPKN
jgi:hypothetical protein